ncbi:MAG: 4'-phosphopantetheinyl transferase superfamily protein [Desulfuromonadaceae bacterium]|nr:4'-phosphopantetheinyl transferase superfamily protein [Desulfuromonadaceae bacterium]
MTPFPWPQQNEVHIHRAVPGINPIHYVSSDERSRADRLLDPCKKKSFLAYRSLLREIFGRYLRIEPEDVHFEIGEQGKPYLSNTGVNKEQLQFNLSHSDTMLLLAVAADREVGIDVERVNIDIPFTDIARIAFSLREQQELFALPGQLQPAAFYRCWARKEAYMKACGMGFVMKSAGFDVTLLPGTPAALITPNKPPGWHLFDITVPEDYYAALAVEGPLPVIRYFD